MFSRPGCCTAGAMALVLACALPAQGATLYTQATATGALATPSAVSYTFQSGGGTGELKLQLQGYSTLDGDNFWIDVLDVRLNGISVFEATYDLGGGGTDRVLAGSAASVAKDATAKTLSLSLALALRSGSNTVAISYSSPQVFEGSNRNGPQGLADEAWGVNRATVTGSSPVVPEPNAWAMLAAGLLTTLTLGNRVGR